MENTEEGIHLQDGELVTGFKRMAHYIIDVIIFNILYFPLDQSLAAKFNPEKDINIDLTVGLLFYMLFFAGYYILFEFLWERSPGKIVTGSYVVNEYGEKPDFITIVKRNLIRFVPFEAFSCISDRGWHDRWSGTFVISNEGKRRIKEILSKVTSEER